MTLNGDELRKQTSSLRPPRKGVNLPKQQSQSNRSRSSSSSVPRSKLLYSMNDKCYSDSEQEDFSDVSPTQVDQFDEVARKTSYFGRPAMKALFRRRRTKQATSTVTSRETPPVAQEKTEEPTSIMNTAAPRSVQRQSSVRSAGSLNAFYSHRISQETRPIRRGVERTGSDDSLISCGTRCSVNSADCHGEDTTLSASGWSLASNLSEENSPQRSIRSTHKEIVVHPRDQIEIRVTPLHDITDTNPRATQRRIEPLPEQRPVNILQRNGGNSLSDIHEDREASHSTDEYSDSDTAVNPEQSDSTDSSSVREEEESESEGGQDSITRIASAAVQPRTGMQRSQSSRITRTSSGGLYPRSNMSKQSSLLSLSSTRSRSRRRRSRAAKQESARSLGGYSVRSQMSNRSRRSLESYKSVMSSQTYLTISGEVQLLLELASDVINTEYLEHAEKYYHKAIHAAGSEIMDINIKMGKLREHNSPATQSMKHMYHEDLRMIGIIIGLLRTKMALLYAEDYDFDHALRLCSGAVQVHRHQPAMRILKKTVDHAEQLPGLMRLIIERLEGAQTCLEQHKEFLETVDLHSTDNTFDFSTASDDCSVLTAKEIVCDMIEHAAQDDESVLSFCDDETVELLSIHAAETDRHAEAEMYLRDALQIHMVALGMKHPNAGESLLRIAKMYGGDGNDRKNEDLVLGYFHQTAAVLERSILGAKERGKILNDIAVIHMRREDFEEAAKFLQDALHTYEEDSVNLRSGRTTATLHVWRNLGQCYIKLEQYRNAEYAFMRALQVQQEARKLQVAAQRLNIGVLGIGEDLKKLISDTSIADTIGWVGKARAASGDHTRALELYREALSVLHQNAEADKNLPDRELLKKRDQVTHTLYCIAESCGPIGDFDRSLRMYQLSIKLRNSNGADKDDKRVCTRVHCIMCYIGIGDLYAGKQEYQKAIKQLKEAINYSVTNNMKETHPVVQQLRSRLREIEEEMARESNNIPEVVKLEKEADALIESGKLDMATATLQKLLALRRSLLKELRDNGLDTADQVYHIACLLQTFGFVFAKNGDDENAERAFKDASRLFRKGGTTPASNPDTANI